MRQKLIPTEQKHRYSVFLMARPPPTSTLFPYTTLFRSSSVVFCTDAEWLIPALFTRMSTWPSRVSASATWTRSEEHTSELQSHSDIVCRLLLEKKNSTKRRKRLHGFQRNRITSLSICIM